ncbi:MAG: hypothetical protein P8N63_16920, partial [Pseudomonadales bacterium]|nr:hypothetical protein [Pseudomonadales bacterium]
DWGARLACPAGVPGWGAPLNHRQRDAAPEKPDPSASRFGTTLGERASAINGYKTSTSSSIAP